MSKILRINTKDKTYRVEELKGNPISLGGRELTSRIVSNEVSSACHPLGRFNKLALTPESLSGTAEANSGRISVGAKSPLTDE